MCKTFLPLTLRTLISISPRVFLSVYELCVPREHTFRQSCTLLLDNAAPLCGVFLPVPRTTTSYSGAISSIVKVLRRNYDYQMRKVNRSWTLNDRWAGARLVFLNFEVAMIGLASVVVTASFLRKLSHSFHAVRGLVSLAPDRIQVCNLFKW